eukprot:756238-Hanusia_phi.AAC.2
MSSGAGSAAAWGWPGVGNVAWAAGQGTGRGEKRWGEERERGGGREDFGRLLLHLNKERSAGEGSNLRQREDRIQSTSRLIAGGAMRGLSA